MTEKETPHQKRLRAAVVKMLDATGEAAKAVAVAHKAMQQAERCRKKVVDLGGRTQK